MANFAPPPNTRKDLHMSSKRKISKNERVLINDELKVFQNIYVKTIDQN